MPHVVHFAGSASGASRLTALSFIAFVEYDRIARKEPKAPSWVMDDYFGSLDRVRQLVNDTLFVDRLSEMEARYLVHACAVLMGHPRLAFMIEDLPNLQCPSCGGGIVTPDRWKS